MRHVDYARVLRPLLPAEAFRPAPQKMLPAAAHCAVVLVTWTAFRFAPPLLYPILALVAGHSLACLALAAHEVSHGAVLRQKLAARCLETVLWTLNWIPATMWRRLHNQSHHAQTNSLNDPDRRYLAKERAVSTWLYTLLFCPNRFLRRNPLALTHFLTYVVRQEIAVFLPGAMKPRINSFKPDYTPQDRWRIGAEIASIAIAQVGVFFMVGGWARWLWAGPAAIAVDSCVMMAYIFTNHFLNPIGEGDDPLAATTSVVVPKIVDRLHFNFSHHAEHHLFPSANSAYYPQMSRLLQAHFPERYNRLRFGEAWRRLSQLDLFVDGPMPPTPSLQAQPAE